MRNTSTALSQRQIKVPFHGAELFVVEHDGQPYVPMKPIVQGVGLDWKTQFRKLNGHNDHSGTSRFGIVDITTQLPGDSQRRAVSCMPLRKLPGWLMSIDAGRVKDGAVRERVVQYQAECDDALWRYWNEGLAINPRAPFTVNPGDTLTADQQETLRLMVKTLVERLPKSKQGAAATKIWSKLKAHFKVPYRQIPNAEFTEAVSIVTRTAAEWELVDDRRPEGFQFAVPSSGRYVVQVSALGSYVYDADDMNVVSSDDLRSVKRDMRTVTTALEELARRMRVLDGTEDRSILRKPVAIDLHLV